MGCSILMLLFLMSLSYQGFKWAGQLFDCTDWKYFLGIPVGIIALVLAGICCLMFVSLFP